MKRNIITAILLSSVFALSVTGCTQKEQEGIVEAVETEEPTEEKVEKEEETKPIEVTGTDLQDIVQGITDHYILQEAEDIDYMYGIAYDEDIVKEITEDSSDVDLAVLGTYDIHYTLTFDRKELLEHIESTDKEMKDSGVEELEDADGSEAEAVTEEEESPEADRAKSEDEQPTESDNDSAINLSEEEFDPSEVYITIPNDDTASGEEDIEINLDKQIEVVTPEKAEELAGEGVDVWTDNNEIVEAQEEEKPKKQETEKNTDSNKKKTDDPKNTNSTDKAQKTTSSGNKNTGSSSSGSPVNKPASSVNDNTSKGTQDHQPTHKHNWVAQTKTVHHDAVTEQVYVVDQAAYDDPIYEWREICNNCGADITNDPGIHSAEFGHSYSSKPVQVGATHHDEVGHYETKTVSEAWDETVTTGYTCSGCGASK